MANLAQTLRQVGYVTPQGQVTGPNAPLAQQLKNYVTNVIPTAAQNLAQQRSDIDAALTMGQGGVQIGDREAFERQMAQVPNLMGLTAYHGTPHTIKGKFDISKVGTGEGAQAYGHGMYFAENPKVAEIYANIAPSMGSYPSMRRSINGVEVEIGSPEAHAATLLSRQGMTVKKAKNLVNSWISDPSAMSAGENTIAGWKKTLDTLNTIKKKSDVKDIGLGNLYKVDIPDEYIPNMLIWEKPLREQPEILKKLGVDVAEFDKLKAQRQTMPEKFDIDIPEELAQYEIANKLNKQMKEMGVDTTGRDFYEGLIKKYGTQKAISEALAQKGIKGIQYFDAGSRGKSAERTRNYVVFDPAEVKILEQNSKPMTRKEILEQELKKVVE
jgi:hypothetical protein